MFRVSYSFGYWWTYFDVAALLTLLKSDRRRKEFRGWHCTGGRFYHQWWTLAWDTIYSGQKQVLIAFGDCAVTMLRSSFIKEDVLNRSYRDAESNDGLGNRQIILRLKLHDKVVPLHEVVAVDFTSGVSSVGGYDLCISRVFKRTYPEFEQERSSNMDKNLRLIRSWSVPWLASKVTRSRLC